MGGVPTTHEPSIGPFVPGVVHGTDGADPVTTEGSMTAATNATIDAPIPMAVVSLIRGQSPAASIAAEIKRPDAITAVCSDVNSWRPKMSSPPG